jgi:hypothetical protein
MQRILLPLLFTLVFLLSVTQAQKEQDRIIMRDGQGISGRLNFLNSTSAQFNGEPIERSKISAVIFAGATTNVPEGDRVEDLVVMRDGRRFSGFVSQVTDQSIVQNSNQFGREKVALIKFALNNRPVLETKPTDKPPPDESGKSEEPEPPTGTVKPEEKSGEDGAQNNNSAGGPPWSEITEDCKFKGKIHIGPSGGSPYRYNEQGSPQELLPHGKVTCTLFYYICGDMFFKGHVINVNAGERCPEWDVPYREICCDQWRAAKEKKDPKKLCDPMKDSDCDGTPNDEDNTPAGPIN